jgi:hypothetical protein
MPRFKRNNEPGPHYHGPGKSKRLIKPGEIIECEPEDLGRFLYKFDALDPAPPPPKEVAYLKSVPRGDKFDVVPIFEDETIGNPINDVPLTKEQAASMTGAALNKQMEKDADAAEG